VRVLPITDDQRDVAAAIQERMVAAGLRAHLDDRNETLKYRVAEGARMKVPYMCVVGRREAEADQVAVNTRGAGEGQKPAPVKVDEFIARVKQEVASRSLTLEGGRA
jgi:threonyl-tRNA synthetase